MVSKTFTDEDFQDLKKKSEQHDQQIHALDQRLNHFNNQNVERSARHFTELTKQISDLGIRINNLIYWILGTGIAIVGIMITILNLK